MKRRAFITHLGGAAVAWPIAARTQQPSRTWRVGYLSPTPFNDMSRPLFGAFRLRLQELGYVEGRNLVLDVRLAEGDDTRLPGLAAELASLRPDVIVAVATPATAAARKATTSIPIVMLGPGDPVGSGFVKSLARPGGNITGLSYMTPDFTAKSLELLRLVVPSAQRIAILMSANPAHASLITVVHGLAQSWGLTIVPLTVVGDADLDKAFEKMGTEKCDALLVLADPRANRRIVELAAKKHLPAIYQLSTFVRVGGLLSYNPDDVDLFRRAALYVDRILKGAAPAELPVEQPTKFELRVNLKTAKALGLTIPESVLVRADEVIE
jgi:putative tryptophan/tyrosine transport system substrate-binding protein